MLPQEALAFGLTLSAFSVIIPRARRSLARSRVARLHDLLLRGIYTMWLKRSTPQNIVIGGAAGAFPPMIGLGLRDRRRVGREHRALPHHLSLDAGAFLGPWLLFKMGDYGASACR
ncbi:hypothetical protein F2981_10460 [Sinorhizobium meliloti]|nr:hypothetical protein [Sinorhizobium meliloti]